MSTIKLTNDVLLSMKSVEGMNGVDTSVVLASNVQNYVATQDCWAVGGCAIGSTITISVDDVQIITQGTQGYQATKVFVPLKKGQKVTFGGTPNHRVIYGIKK